MKFLLQRLAILLSSFVLSNAYGMTFYAPKHNMADVLTWIDAHGDTIRIYADGAITNTTTQDFEQFVKANNIKSGMVLINSPGGSLIGGINLGSAIRSHGFDTGIATYSKGYMAQSGICASACVYAFAGGAGRYYSGGNTRLGIHQFYSQGADVGNQVSQETSGLIVAFLQKMGVDALAFSASTSVQPDDIYWLSVDDANKLHFSNNGTQPTTAELKQVLGQTYLTVEQKYTNFSSKLLFTCMGKDIELKGGIITNPKDVKEKYDWATHSFFTFDDKTIQMEYKKSKPTSIIPYESSLWVIRMLTKKDIKSLFNSKTVTVWVGADGAIGYTGPVDIGNVKDKIQSYMQNCFI